MQMEPYIPINFTISAEAWAEIDNIRRFWDAQLEDKADVPVVTWGRTVLNDGRSWSHVVVSFYGKSERYKIIGEIQTLSGREIVFSTVPEHYEKFEGKITRYNPERSFYLSTD